MEGEVGTGSRAACPSTKHLSATCRGRCTGWQSTPVVNIFKQCDVENKKNVELSGKVALRMVRVQAMAYIHCKH